MTTRERGPDAGAMRVGVSGAGVVGDGGEERAHRDGGDGGKGQESAKMRRRGLVGKIPTVLLVVED